MQWYSFRITMKLTIMTICCLVLIYFISETYGCKYKNETDKQKFCGATYGKLGQILVYR